LLLFVVLIAIFVPTFVFIPILFFVSIVLGIILIQDCGKVTAFNAMNRGCLRRVAGTRERSCIVLDSGIYRM